MKISRSVSACALFVAAIWIAGCQGAPVPDASPSEPMAVGDTPSRAQAADGTYISWREHIVDSFESNGGVPVSGSDGLTGGDLDLDGHMDVVSVHESDTAYDDVPDGHIRLAFGSEDPDRWTLATLAEGLEAAAPEDADIADVNGDGHPDIIAASELAHLIYFQNPGNQEAARRGEWERLIIPVSKNRGSYIRVFFADFDGDGKPEAIAPNKGGQNPTMNTEQLDAISWFEITGDPLDGDSWVEHVITEVRIPINSRPIDLDQDGDLDVLGGSRGERRIFFLENLGGETIEFENHPIEIAADPPPVLTGFNFQFADLNEDGRLDVIVQAGVGEQGYTGGAAPNLIWLEQPADLAGMWTAHTIGTVYPDAMTGFSLADINEDGRDDLIAGGYSQGPRDHDGEDVTRDGKLGRLVWLEQPEDPTTEWIRHDISRRKRGMFDKFLVKDMDGDGDVDFIATRGNSVPFDGVFWLEQVRTTEPVASFERARAQDSIEMPLPSEPKAE